jgi:hypothetical protein
VQSKNSPTEIHKVVVEVYGENVIPRKQVSVWCNQFKEGRTSLLDEERAGRPTSACDAVNERRVEQLLLADRHMKLNEIAYAFNLSKTCWNAYSRCHSLCITMQLPTLLEKHVKPFRRWVGKFSNTPLTSLTSHPLTSTYLES